MKSFNKIIILGFLHTEPKRAINKTNCVTFEVATNELIKDGGERTQITDWHKIEVYGRLAETCIKMLQKGSKVLVEGRVRNSIESKYTIIARDITFISNFNGTFGGNNGQ